MWEIKDSRRKQRGRNMLDGHNMEAGMWTKSECKDMACILLKEGHNSRQRQISNRH